MKLPVSILVSLLLVSAAPGEDFQLLRKQVAASPAEELQRASGLTTWNAESARTVSGLANPKLTGGRVTGDLTSAPARFPVPWSEPADLDLGYNDWLDLDLQLPENFTGRVALEYRAQSPPTGGEADPIRIPGEVLAADGSRQHYRLDLGLVPSWRGFLREATLVIEATAGGGSVAVGLLRVGDLPGEKIEVFTDLNLKPEIDAKDLLKMESKHGCIWWTKEHEAEGFDPEVMPRRSLRMLEESWQIAVNLLGYRDPCLGTVPSNKDRNKINHTTWHDGFWMGGDRPFPYFNVSEGGLRDEGWGNPVPHEFVHCVQAAQINFLRGAHWESHANYVRFHRNLHFKEWVGIDPMPFKVLARANYYQDHPSLIYSDYRPYFYLDSDPDRLGFEPGLTAKLWQTGKADELFWDRLPSVLPDGVTRETVAAGIARSWVTFDFVGGKEQQEAYFTDDPAGALRRHAYHSPLVAVSDRLRHWAVPLAKAPMKFGWCVHELRRTGDVVQAKLEGIDIAGDGENWRWGFVAFKKDGSHLTSPIFEPGAGRFDPPKDLDRLLLFVVATPADPSLPYSRATPEFATGRHPEHRRYPYEITFDGAVPADHVVALETPPGSKHKNGGGFVADSAKVDASAHVGPSARVLGSAKVTGNARILDHAVIMGAATVEDDAIVSGGALVTDNAGVSGQARVRGFATVGGQSKVGGRARVGDFADVPAGVEIAGDAIARGTSQPLNRAKIGGHAILDTDYSMDFDLNDGVHFHHVPWGGWYFEEFAAKQTKPRGLVASYLFAESDGAQALDEFGALHATLRGRPERSGDGVELDGNKQYVTLDSSIIDAPAATWLIEAVSTGRGTQPLFAINDWKKDGLMIGVSDSGRLAAVLKQQGRPTVTLASRIPVSRGGDLRVGLRLDGETAALFQNGKKVAEQSWSPSPSEMFRDLTSEAPTGIYLGRDSEGQSMTGRLSRFRAFNIALDDDEIAGSF